MALTCAKGLFQQYHSSTFCLLMAKDKRNIISSRESLSPGMVATLSPWASRGKGVPQKSPWFYSRICLTPVVTRPPPPSLTQKSSEVLGSALFGEGGGTITFKVVGGRHEEAELPADHSEKGESGGGNGKGSPLRPLAPVVTTLRSDCTEMHLTLLRTTLTCRISVQRAENARSGLRSPPMDCSYPSIGAGYRITSDKKGLFEYPPTERILQIQAPRCTRLGHQNWNTPPLVWV